MKCNVRNFLRCHHLSSWLKVLIGNQTREKLRSWFAPPNPSVNHNTACGTQHDGTAEWFIRGSTFGEWKKNGFLLWIRGNRMLLKHFHTFMTVNVVWFFSGVWQEYPLVRSYTTIPVIRNL